MLSPSVSHWRRQRFTLHSSSSLVGECECTQGLGNILNSELDSKDRLSCINLQVNTNALLEGWFNAPSNTIFVVLHLKLLRVISLLLANICIAGLVKQHGMSDFMSDL